jgi:hypothetical protein
VLQGGWPGERAAAAAEERGRRDGGDGESCTASGGEPGCHHSEFVSL